jgi:hypothetical protein
MSYGWKRSVHASRNIGRSTTRFRPSPTLYSLYVNDTLQTQRVHLVLFADIAKKAIFWERYNEVSLQWSYGVSAGTNTSEDKTQAIYFSHRTRPVETHLTMEGRNIPNK